MYWITKQKSPRTEDALANFLNMVVPKSTRERRFVSSVDLHTRATGLEREVGVAETFSTDRDHVALSTRAETKRPADEAHDNETEDLSGDSKHTGMSDSSTTWTQSALLEPAVCGAAPRIHKGQEKPTLSEHLHGAEGVGDLHSEG